MSLAEYVKLVRSGQHLPPAPQKPAMVSSAPVVVMATTFVVAMRPERGPMKPRRISDLIKSEDAVETVAFYAVWHRECRNGRCGRRPAHKPEYKCHRRQPGSNWKRQLAAI